LILEAQQTGEQYSVLTTAEGAMPEPRKVAERLMGPFIDVRPMNKDVDMIRVTATSTDPAEAEKIANLYAEEYLSYNLQQSRRQMQEAGSFIEDQVQELEGEINTIETELENLEAGASAVSLQAQAQQILQQIGNLEASRNEAEITLNVASEQLDELKSRKANSEQAVQTRMTSGVETRIANTRERLFRTEADIEDYYLRTPRLRDNPSAEPKLVELLRQKGELESQLRTLSQQYTEEVNQIGGIDPSVDGSNPIAYLSSLNTEIAQKEIEVRGQRRAVEVFDRQLGRYRALLSRIPATTIQQARQERKLNTRETIYGELSESYIETKIRERSEAGYATIVDNAVEPRSPVRPNVALNLILGSLFGLVLGMCIVFLRNAMDNRIRKPEDLRKMGITVLGVVPDMEKIVRDDFEGQDRITGEGRSYSTSLIALLNPLSPVSETYRRLRTNIQFSRLDRDVQVIMVTSSGPGEGKTVTAANLAVTMAQAGRPTLYIDADLRRPTGHKMLGLSREPGLVELLFEKYPLDLETFATGIDDLYAIPAGSSVPNPAELMGSQKMKEMINRLREEFDYIIIDTPPVLAVTDAVLLSTNADAAVIVISANETDFHSLARSVESLQAVDAPLAGAVLNRFNVKRAYGYYGYRYSYGYGYGYKYGYDENTDQRREADKGLSRIFSRSNA
ncbi:MAG: polysaccharide biosynthesis tyrosine autokinase, partial [Bacteroidota bacterium]